MLVVNQVPFKQAVHQLIDETMKKSEDPSIEWRDEFRNEVVRLAKEHRIPITASEYAKQLSLLLMARNVGRAHKLVDALDDEGPSVAGAVLVAALKVVIKYGLLALFILGILWAYNNCGT